MAGHDQGIEAPLAELIDQLAWEQVGAVYDFSAREREIAGLLLRERSERDVAKQLNLSVHTVHTYSSRIYRKVGAKTRVGLLLRILATLKKRPGPGAANPHESEPY